MADYFLVTRVRGPAWDYARARREQPGWAEHAAFMDALVEEGFVVLGGPVGEGGVSLIRDLGVVMHPGALYGLPSEDMVTTCLHRPPWPIEEVVSALRDTLLPS